MAVIQARQNGYQTSCVQVGQQAQQLLELLDEEAAAANDLQRLFQSADRFPTVFQRRRAVADCQAGLEALLPSLRRLLRLPRLAFTSVHNQGDFLVEVPADQAGIPQACFCSSRTS